MTSGSKNFTSASLNCTAARKLETIHVVAADTAAALLQTTIASCSGSTFVMTAAASENISGTAKWIIGHDDTVPIQTAWNASFNAAGFAINAVYFPAGNYLVTAPLNFTGVSISHLYGAGEDVSQIYCSSASSSVCVDTSVGNNENWEYISFNNGIDAQDASTVNWLAGRTVTGSNKIGDKFHYVGWRSWGAWNFYGFLNEQAKWTDCYWEADGTSTVNLTLSSLNTAGITSPFVTLVTPQVAIGSTVFSIDGSDTTFDSNNGGGTGKPHILIDGYIQVLNLFGPFFADGIYGARTLGMSMIGDGGTANPVLSAL